MRGLIVLHVVLPFGTAYESFVEMFLDSEDDAKCSFVVPRTGFPQTFEQNLVVLEYCHQDIDDPWNGYWTRRQALDARSHLLTTRGVIGDIFMQEKEWKADPMSCAESCFRNAHCHFWQFGPSLDMKGYMCLNANYAQLAIAMNKVRIQDVLLGSQRQLDCAKDPTFFIADSDLFYGQERHDLRSSARISGFRDEWETFCQLIPHQRYDYAIMSDLWLGDATRMLTYLPESFHDSEADKHDCFNVDHVSNYCIGIHEAFDRGIVVHDAFIEDYGGYGGLHDWSPWQCAHECWLDSDCVFWQMSGRTSGIDHGKLFCYRLRVDDLRDAMTTHHDETTLQSSGYPLAQRWCRSILTSYVHNTNYIDGPNPSDEYTDAKYGGWTKGWNFETVCDYFTK